MNEMTTPTDLAQALRELTDACEAEYCSADTDGEGDDSKVAFPEESCSITFGMIRRARAALTAHESRAQPAINHDDVDDVLAQVHGLARKINDDPDEATNASADILTIIEKARSPRRGLLAAQPASVPDPDWLANLRHELRMSKITHNFTLTRDELAYILGDPLLAPMPAQPASVADGWQPMETAPKGGGAERTDDPAYIKPPRILIRFGDEAVSVAYWDWYYAEGGCGFTDGFAWIEPCSGEPLNLHYTTPPDGWMSPAAAPQPPEEKQ